MFQADTQSPGNERQSYHIRGLYGTCSSFPYPLKSYYHFESTHLRNCLLIFQCFIPLIAVTMMFAY